MIDIIFPGKRNTEFFPCIREVVAEGIEFSVLSGLEWLQHRKANVWGQKSLCRGTSSCNEYSILFYPSNSFFQTDRFPLSSLKSDKKGHIVLFCNAMCLGPGLVINCLSGGMLWYVNHNSTSPLDLFNVNKILSEFLLALRAVLYN